jgi:Fe-S-cluster-containing dehydrogenase component/CRP-like cAMP-binding protein
MSEPASELLEERNRRWDEPFGDEPLDAATVAYILSLPTFVNVDPTEFQAWLPLDQILANDGRLRRYQPGEVILRKGDYGSSLFVILEGGVLTVPDKIETDGQGQATKRGVSWRRSIAQLFASAKPPEYRSTRRRWRGRGSAFSPSPVPSGLAKVDIDDVKKRHQTITLQPPDVFGELAALTGRQRIATVIATEDDTLLFELRWQGVRDIRTWSTPFRQRIDQLYRERGLVGRLRECPLLHHLDRQALDEIAKESLFETYGNADWMHRFKRERQADVSRVIEQETVICEQGGHVDGLVLINRGFARITERVDYGEQAIDHLSVNDVFGLDEIAAIAAGETGVALKASLRAIGYVDIIRIPTKLACKYVLPGLPVHLRNDRRVLASSEPATIKMQQDMMDFLVDHRFINGEQAMVINLDRCVGCDDCVKACATAHDNNPRFRRHGFSHHNAMVVNACMHCTDPVCLIGCPTGAIHREENSGTVVINDGTCIGCATCANSCPYDNIKMVDIRDKTGAFLLDSDGQTISRATKCDLCVDQLTGPACVQACPHDALIRIDIRDSRKLLAWLG